MEQLVICPLRRLYRIAQECDPRRDAALAVSSCEIRTELLSGFTHLLTLCFADAALPMAANVFELQQARQIKAFVDALPETIGTLFICCDSGESRSAAMAAAILRYRGMDEWDIWKNPHYHPNPLVYSRLCSAFGVRRCGLKRRLKCSRKAFRKAVKASARQEGINILWRFLWRTKKKPTQS